MILKTLSHAIPQNKPIDYYIWKYPSMVKAYFECINGKVPIDPYANNIIDHIQLVIQEHNEVLSRTQKIINRYTAKEE